MFADCTKSSVLGRSPAKGDISSAFRLLPSLGENIPYTVL